jgi:peptide/nickel transport system permease protein
MSQEIAARKRMGRSPGLALLRRALRTRSLVVGAVLFLLVLLLVLVTPLIAPLDPLTINYGQMLQAPTPQHSLGTDEVGRDLLSRVIIGGRASLMIGLEVMIATALLGTLIALAIAFFDAADMVVMRLMDIMMAFPSLLLAIALLAILRNSPIGVVIALTVVYTPRTVRVLRSEVLTLRELLYVEAARAVGVRTPTILVRHILPGIFPVLVVQETFLFAYAILAEAGISFVGVGVQPPQPSWGNILGDARAILSEAPWLVVFPGLAIMASVLSLNLIGDGLREILDPRRRKNERLSLGKDVQ